MKIPTLLLALLSTACVAPRPPRAAPIGMAIAYRDLALENRAGRAELVRRVRLATQRFCAAYDPQDTSRIFDVRLASPRHCPGYATLLLMARMPAQGRHALRIGLMEERSSIAPS